MIRKKRRILTRSLTVLYSSLRMALATFVSRILGLVREQVMASLFGASGLTDAFLVAYRIPNLLRDLFAEGAFSSSFVPSFSEAKNEGLEKSRELLWSLFYLLLFTTLFFSTISIIFAPEIIALFAPTFVEDKEKFEVTVTLTRMMSPFLVFVSIAALFMGALNSMKAFFIPALAPSFFNVVMILSMLFFPSLLLYLGYPTVYSMGIGVFLGGIAQALVQVPLLFKFKLNPFYPRPLLSKRSKDVFKKLGPGLIGFAATQINLLINTILASSTVVGAVSWLSYSFRLFQLPVGILSVSIGNSNLVHFSDAIKSGKREEAKGYLLSSYYLSYILILPALLVLYLLSDDIVKLVFERGKFDSFATLMTAKALRLYAIGLPFYGIYKIIVPTFYALDKQKIPVYSSIFTIAVNIIFCVWLTPIYGFEILALGTTMSMLLNSSILLWILRKELNFSFSDFIGIRTIKLFFVTGSVGFLTTLLSKWALSSQMGIFELAILISLKAFLIYFLYGTGIFVLGERSAVLGSLKKIRQIAKRFL